MSVRTRRPLETVVATVLALAILIPAPTAIASDPTSPTKIRALYDSGDHGHPNDLGYNALANAIDLKLFRTDQGQH